ncbi:hypothetical protein VTK56DRAFT_9112 [Thermocarpiscus australiensis]
MYHLVGVSLTLFTAWLLAFSFRGCNSRGDWVGSFGRLGGGENMAEAQGFRDAAATGSSSTFPCAYKTMPATANRRSTLPPPASRVMILGALFAFAYQAAAVGIPRLAGLIPLSRSARRRPVSSELYHGSFLAEDSRRAPRAVSAGGSHRREAVRARRYPARRRVSTFALVTAE